jgi:hypothetical protein
MLVRILYGETRNQAEEKGSMRFARCPEKDESVIIDDEAMVVSGAWHSPSIHFAEPKFTILVHKA